MSIIPKISIGIHTKRQPSNMSFDCHTTANIGFCQPTMARLLIPNSHIEVKNKTLVRMSPLINPTAGRLSQRDYYTFTPMFQIYEPWAQFLKGANYNSGNGTSFIPSVLPKFKMSDVVIDFLMNNADYGFSPAFDPRVSIGASSHPVSGDLTLFVWYVRLLNTLIDDVQPSFGSEIFGTAEQRSSYFLQAASYENFIDPFSFGSLIYESQNQGVCAIVYESSGIAENPSLRSVNREILTFDNSDYTVFIPASIFTSSNLEPLTIQYPDGQTYSCDPATQGLYMHFRLKPWSKNIRKIFIGLGYGFSPFDKLDYTPFKFMAFYKTWFDSFYPQRDLNYQDTDMYNFQKKIQIASGIRCISDFLYVLERTQRSFYYFTQPDYFSASVADSGDTTLNQYQTTEISSPIGGPQSNTPNTVTSSRSFNGKADLEGTLQGLTISMMLRLMRFTNKNSVLGRSIRDFAKAHYNIDDIHMDSMQVNKINSSRVDIDFSDVMSTAETDAAYLGEYAGKGIGYRESEKSTFDNKDFGIFICMSVLVPESGYYQGSLKENTLAEKFDFWTEEFDALGYEVISRGELLNDFHVKSPDFNPAEDYDTTLGYGLIPRYTHIKVGRNIVNGDLTLPSTKASLEGYYLDKEFPTVQEESVDENRMSLIRPSVLPMITNISMRRIDPSDEVGNYNRIFQYQGIDVDHYIIHKVFDVEVTAPWKSISDSYDTFNEGDDATIERNHV